MRCLGVAWRLAVRHTHRTKPLPCLLGSHTVGGAQECAGQMVGRVAYLAALGSGVARGWGDVAVDVARLVGGVVGRLDANLTDHTNQPHPCLRQLLQILVGLID